MFIMRKCYFVNITNERLALDIQKDGIDGGVFEECERYAKENLDIEIKIIADDDYNIPLILLKALSEDPSSCVLIDIGHDSELITDPDQLEILKDLLCKHPDEKTWELVLKNNLVDIE